jgi:cytochrome b561
VCGGQEETNGTDHYPANSKLLHWLVAVCVLTTAPVAIAMTRMQGTDPGHSLQFHKSLGVLILILMILRLINRLAVGALTAAPEIEPWQKTISSVVHTSLYVLFDRHADRGLRR